MTSNSRARPGDAVGFQCRGHRQADGLFGAGGPATTRLVCSGPARAQHTPPKRRTISSRWPYKFSAACGAPPLPLVCIGLLYRTSPKKARNKIRERAARPAPLIGELLLHSHQLILGGANAQGLGGLDGGAPWRLLTRSIKWSRPGSALCSTRPRQAQSARRGSGWTGCRCRPCRGSQPRRSSHSRRTGSSSRPHRQSCRQSGRPRCWRRRPWPPGRYPAGRCSPHSTA